MRIVASLVTKNEEYRYLDSFLDWNSPWWDDLFIFDDQSSDDTRHICEQYGIVVERPDVTPPFIEDEAAFRYTAWVLMEERMNLKEGDFIFSIDADEFLVATTDSTESIRSLLEETAGKVLHFDRFAANIDIPEVWDDSYPWMIRKDGLWTNKRLPRLTRYVRDGVFRNKKMGCGSTPTYSYENMLEEDFGVSLLHVGYANEDDRRDRYERYMSLPNHGHNPQHIMSIMSYPRLEEWTGAEVPDLWCSKVEV